MKAMIVNTGPIELKSRAVWVFWAVWKNVARRVAPNPQLPLQNSIRGCEQLQRKVSKRTGKASLFSSGWDETERQNKNVRSVCSETNVEVNERDMSKISALAAFSDKNAA